MLMLFLKIQMLSAVRLELYPSVILFVLHFYVPSNAAKTNYYAATGEEGFANPDLNGAAASSYWNSMILVEP